MADELMQDMQEVIARNLPQQTAGALKLRLEQADRDAAKLKETQAKLEETLTHLKALQGENASFRLQRSDLAARETAVHQRENAVADVEVRLKLMEKDVDCAQRIQKAVTDVVGQVFNNHTIHRTIHERGHEPVWIPKDQYGNGGYVGTGSAEKTVSESST